ncbi:unnamed protein product [Polarella glacialis]|uniref:Uncharacterized protein n=1 Tax=Polarella glacialis TaxID=89957 RepID=A0A813M5N9_POLGL|nr:unnamed protein product [Polarella glacialis]CAE8741572.1 unnamed protein product [Polarella glacialis]
MTDASSPLNRHRLSFKQPPPLEPQKASPPESAPPREHVMRILIGMGGQFVEVEMTDGLSFDAVLAAVRSSPAAPPFPQTWVKLVASGAAVRSMEALCCCEAEQDPVFAVFLRSLDEMELSEVAEELAMEEAEFKGHAFALSKLPPGSHPREVADYLWTNNLLLTSSQSTALFDTLLHKLVASGRHPGCSSVRGELIFALHSFCLQQHHAWEPNDGSSECMWAGLGWNGKLLGLSQRLLTRGRLQQWGNVEASASSSSNDSWPSWDVSQIRAIAVARREEKPEPLAHMMFVRSHDHDWWKL